ncbi:MAG: methyltransferase protein [Pycnora praestabilis]|nr:MAG: methyltransferase protein [Pycnora praestabilis]
MDSPTGGDDFTPLFYVGQHESKRALPVTDRILRQAQDCNYDMLTTPITSPHFHSRVLALLSCHLSQLRSGSNASVSASYDDLPLPIIPPLTPVDTPLTPNKTIAQLLAVTSPWIDLCSPDPLIANVSRQVLSLEIAYAAFCGVGNIIIIGPKFRYGKAHADGLAQYARAVQEALNVGAYVQIQILLPITDHPELDIEDEMGDLAPFAREEYVEDTVEKEARRPDLYGTWDAWNVIRTLCKYSARLFVALSLPRHLPPLSIQSRWHSEPVRLLSINASSYLRNPKSFPVLSKTHQALISRFMRLRNPPWILLSEVGPIPGLDDPNAAVPVADGFLSPSTAADAAAGAGSPLPTPAEASQQQSQFPLGAGSGSRRIKDPTPHLSYIRHLQRNQPSRSIIERFGSGYQDYLQAPLQPLTDNLESITYEVFEKDPVKYDWYERAIAQALSDWVAQGKYTSGADSKVVVAVVGAGRGPLVTRVLRASEGAGVPVEVWAVEKNPNAYVVLQRHNEEDWQGRVTVVKSDMRSWKGPWHDPITPIGHATTSPPPMSMSETGAESERSGYGTVDILVSELLGSFADNELSPECLDGVQHVLNPTHGISIPSSYTAHLTPIAAPRLHADISSRSATDPAGPETPYVVMLHAIDFLSTISSPSSTAPTASTTATNNTIQINPLPHIQTAWSFTHPLPPSTLALSALRRSGSLSGGGGGLTGGAGANEHNTRYSRMNFKCRDRGVCHGLAGYFEAVLYEGGGREGGVGRVELSTNPETMETKSRDMTSWFPIFFPLKTPMYLPDNSELEVSIWRQTDDRKVWYEWLVEAFLVVGSERRVRLGVSDLHSSQKNGCLM